MGTGGEKETAGDRGSQEGEVKRGNSVGKKLSDGECVMWAVGVVIGGPKVG